MTNETLEKAAENESEYLSDYEDKDMYQRGFIAGAKWEKENSNVNALHFEIDALKREIEILKHQQERMYSEEDMRLSFETGRNFQLTGEDNFKELLEQFKKK